MKKRLLSLLLILCLCAALLPVAVFAEGNVIELTDNYINEKLIKESEVADGKTIYHYRNALPAGKLPPDRAISRCITRSIGL